LTLAGIFPGKVKESVILMDIQLLDHFIIIPEGRYYSVADEGVL
jgi:DNA repair protein RadC